MRPGRTGLKQARGLALLNSGPNVPVQSSRQRCHHGGRVKGGGQGRNKQTHSFSIGLALPVVRAHTKCVHSVASWASMEENKSETRIRTPHAAWLNESSKSRASIQFIREPLAAALV